MGKQWKQWLTLFSWAPKSLQMVTEAMKLKNICSLEEKLWQTREHTEKQRHYLADKGPSSQSYVFSSSHIWMWELDHKVNWESKNWCCWTVVLEKTIESPLDCKEIQLFNPKGNQSWIFTGRTDAEAEVPILWPPNGKKLSQWKRPWCWERLKAKGKGDNGGWDGWMASPAQWTWAWVSPRSWRRTGKPGVLWAVGLQRVRHDWATELIREVHTLAFGEMTYAGSWSLDYGVGAT